MFQELTESRIMPFEAVIGKALSVDYGRPEGYCELQREEGRGKREERAVQLQPTRKKYPVLTSLHSVNSAIKISTEYLLVSGGKVPTIIID